ncbi:unnamed protein product [Cunninghamella blakesleeana]
MADDFCFALLRTTLLQILQSAGFESVQLSSADAMTDILGQYLEVLANTVTNFAQLSGRTDGNALDVLDGLAELNINIEDLEDWLNVEGKDFIPAWSEQADPSRIINTKKEDIDHSFTFEYSDSDSWDDLDALISSPMTGINISPSPPSSSNQHNNSDNDNLPKYVPDYLPSFPVLNKEDEMDPLNDVKELQATLPLSQTNNPLPHHLTVKKKKKPITNPFTHITPYEESIIATDKDTPTPMALSALEISSSTMGGAPSSPIPPYSTSEQRDIPLKRVMESFEKGKDVDQPSKKAKFTSSLSSLSSSKESLINIFQQATQDDASAGTRLFGRSTSILNDIVRNLAPPLALSTLSTPNLMVDVMNISNNNESSDTNNNLSSTSNLSSSASAPNLITIPAKSDINNNGNNNNNNNNINNSGSSGISLTISTKNITSAPTSPTKPTAISIKTKSASMNPSLNRDDDDIFSINSLEKERKESSSSTSVFSPPPSIPSTTTLTNPTTSGSPISLASLANKVTSSSKQQSQKSARKLTINLSNLQKKSEDHPSSSSSSTTITTTNTNTNTNTNTTITNNNNNKPRQPKSVTIKSSSSTPLLNDHHQNKSKSLTSSSSASSLSNKNSNNNGSSTSSYHQQPYSSPSPIVSPSLATAPKIRFTLKPPEPIIKAEPTSPTISSSSILPSHSTATSRPLSTTTSSSQSSISKPKPKPKPKQTNNNNTISLKKANTTPSTTKITTVPVPPPSTSYQYNNNSNTTSSSDQVEDIIRCICENPTIDYGAFMIACDKCGVWYHGSCVGVSENDQVEEWYCQLCQTLN